MTINLVALIFSVLAIAVSGWMALRQTRIMRQANQLPIIVELFQEFRGQSIQDSERFILLELRRQHDPNLGYTNLPEPAKAHVHNINTFFISIGVLIAYGVIDAEIMITIIGYRAQQIWSVLEPFVRREREIRGSSYGDYFEDFVSRCCRTPPETLMEQLKLGRMPVGRS